MRKKLADVVGPTENVGSPFTSPQARPLEELLAETTDRLAAAVKHLREPSFDLEVIVEAAKTENFRQAFDDFLGWLTIFAPESIADAALSIQVSLHKIEEDVWP